MSDKPEPMMKGKEVCRMLGISRYQLARLVEDGELPAHKWTATEKGHLYFKRADVEAFIDSRRVGGGK